MTINFKQKLVNPIDQKGIVDQNNVALTLKMVCANALFNMVPDEVIETTEKTARYLIAVKIAKTDEVDLEAEEIVKIKEAVGKAYAPIIVGQVFEMLEKKSK